MTTSRKQLVFDTFDNKPADYMPCGFWFHFLQPDDKFNSSREYLNMSLAGHKDYFDRVQPDFMKLMADGTFRYPFLFDASKITHIHQLVDYERGDVDGWIDMQVKQVRELQAYFGDDVASFYNIFAPMSYLRRFLLQYGGKVTMADFMRQDPVAFGLVLDRIGVDIAKLCYRVITEGRMDGVYFCVQNIQEGRFSAEEYLTYVAPSELQALGAANMVSDYNILHVCGFARATNIVKLYSAYPAKAINWAVYSDHLTMKDGKKLFGGRCVIGGFDNAEDGVLFKGSRAEIEAETEKIIRDNSLKTGFVLGADCSLPYGIDYDHLVWAKEKAHEFSRKFYQE